MLDCSEVETVNQQVIAAKIDDALRSINIPSEKFVLLLSDAASCMTAATKEPLPELVPCHLCRAHATQLL